MKKQAHKLFCKTASALQIVLITSVITGCTSRQFFEELYLKGGSKDSSQATQPNNNSTQPTNTTDATTSILVDSPAKINENKTTELKKSEKKSELQPIDTIKICANGNPEGKIPLKESSNLAIFAYKLNSTETETIHLEPLSNINLSAQNKIMKEKLELGKIEINTEKLEDAIYSLKVCNESFGENYCVGPAQIAPFKSWSYFIKIKNGKIISKTTSLKKIKMTDKTYNEKLKLLYGRIGTEGCDEELAIESEVPTPKKNIETEKQVASAPKMEFNKNCIIGHTTSGISLKSLVNSAKVSSITVYYTNGSKTNKDLNLIIPAGGTSDVVEFQNTKNCVTDVKIDGVSIDHGTADLQIFGLVLDPCCNP